MLTLCKKIAVRLVPFSVRRWLFHPMIAPSDYRKEIALAESILALRHHSRGLDEEFWAAVLRKYAHILDKGLQRCDCEPGHSGEFFQLAHASLRQLSSDAALSDPSVQWAKGRIAAYEKLQHSGRREDPVPPYVPAPSSFEALDGLIRTRRSIRSFTAQPVPRELLAKIVATVNWASSSCNRQTVKVFVADQGPLVEACLAANSGATCFDGGVPCFVCFCADLRAYDMPQEMTLPVLDVALGMQNCCLAAHALGCAVTLLNWTHHTDEQDRQLRRLLGIPSHFRIVANGALGYPSQGAPVPERKSARHTYTFVESGANS